MTTHQPPNNLLLKIIIWLLPCFFIWYQFSSIFLWPVYFLSQFILNGLFPNAIDSLLLTKHNIEVLSFFDSKWIGAYSGQDGDITLQINALKYTYSLPLLAAMTFSASGTYRTKVKFIAIGFSLLFLVQTWGVCFEIFKTIIFDVGTIISQRTDTSSTRDLAQFCMQMNQFGCHSFSRNLIALFYQLGYLILPGISPLLIWAYLHFDYLQSISPSLKVLAKPVPKLPPSKAKKRKKKGSRKRKHY